MGAIDCSSVCTSAGNTSRDSAYMQWYWWNTLCGNPDVMLKPQNPPMLVPESFRRKQLPVAQQSQVTSIWKCFSSFACHVSPIGAAIANERTKFKFKRKTQRATWPFGESGCQKFFTYSSRNGFWMLYLYISSHLATSSCCIFSDLIWCYDSWLDKKNTKNVCTYIKLYITNHYTKW